MKLLTYVDIFTNKRYIDDMEEIKEYIKRKKNIRDQWDLVLIDDNADELNAEAKDVLSYQVKIDDLDRALRIALAI